MPEISILMPVYNGEAFLSSAVKSVQAQTWTDWELIVIDDGSSDQSKDIVNSLAHYDKRIKLLARSENKGLIYSLNQGLTIAVGEFIARLDCDDEWSDPAKLKLQRERFEKDHRLGLLGTWGRVINLQGQPVKKIIYAQSDTQLRKQILIHNCFIHSSIMARRQALEESGGYLAEDIYVEDYGLWLRVGKRWRLENLPMIMVNYRENPFGITQTLHSQQLNSAIQLISQYKNFYPNYFFALIKWYLQKVLNNLRWLLFKF